MRCRNAGFPPANGPPASVAAHSCQQLPSRFCFSPPEPGGSTSALRPMWMERKEGAFLYRVRNSFSAGAGQAGRRTSTRSAEVWRLQDVRGAGLTDEDGAAELHTSPQAEGEPPSLQARPQAAHSAAFEQGQPAPPPSRLGSTASAHPTLAASPPRSSPQRCPTAWHCSPPSCPCTQPQAEAGRQAGRGSLRVVPLQAARHSARQGL